MTQLTKKKAAPKELTLQRQALPERLLFWAMVIPGMILTFMFITRTWPGVLIAFEDFVTTKGWYESEWTGLDNFKLFFMQPDAFRIIRNTMVIAVGKTIVGMIAAITYALLINEVRNMKLKRTLQTCTYMTHFISWVIYATIIKSILGTNGLFNNALQNAGKNKIMFLGNPATFPIILIVAETIKEFGWNAIIQLSAISGIDPCLYEAAELDGANRWQQTWHVTLPGLRPTIVVCAILSIGQIMSAGFDQVFNLQNQLVMSTGDTLETWVYRNGLVNMNYGVGTAVGLMNSILVLCLMAFTYWAADKYANYKVL